VVVVGAPLYNFSVPSQLKAWIDRVAQVGRTFKYTEKGPQGLAGGKTVVVVSSRGGAYGQRRPPTSTRRVTCKVVFGFFGITDVRFVRAEGLAMGDAARAKALAAAAREIRAVALPAANDASSKKSCLNTGQRTTKAMTP
jgi:FMN-dependent NADH-azoreductase